MAAASMVRTFKGTYEDTWKCPRCGLVQRAYIGTDPSHQVSSLDCLQRQVDSLRHVLRDIATGLEGGP